MRFISNEKADDDSKEKPIIIGGKILNLEQIFKSSGDIQIETGSGSEKFINITVSSGKIDIRPSGNSPFFFRAEILSPGELGMNLFLKQKNFRSSQQD